VDFGSKDVGCAILDPGYRVGGKSCVRENRRFLYVWELSSLGGGRQDLRIYPIGRSALQQNSTGANGIEMIWHERC
jgi:hypothetical protein